MREVNFLAVAEQAHVAVFWPSLLALHEKTLDNREFSAESTLISASVISHGGGGMGGLPFENRVHLDNVSLESLVMVGTSELRVDNNGDDNVEDEQPAHMCDSGSRVVELKRPSSRSSSSTSFRSDHDVVLWPD